jgi:glycosyltransferase involved in cell wall biosynthesis
MAAQGDSRVIFLGARSDVADLLKGADILVSNSSEEGFPLALLEGCATGVHILASRIPAHERIRELFPEQVTLYSLGGEGSLARALDELGCANRRRVICPPADALGKISGRTMSRQYQDLYDALT